MAINGATYAATLFGLFNRLSVSEERFCRCPITESKYQVCASEDRKENQQRKINLWERLDDYFHLKLFKINVYI